jgi:MFS family permease
LLEFLGVLTALVGSAIAAYQDQRTGEIGDFLGVGMVLAAFVLGAWQGTFWIVTGWVLATFLFGGLAAHFEIWGWGDIYILAAIFGLIPSWGAIPGAHFMPFQLAFLISLAMVTVSWSAIHLLKKRDKNITQQPYCIVIFMALLLTVLAGWAI